MDSSPATEPLGETWQYNPDYHRTADFLGVNIYDRRDYKIAKKIAALSDWAEHKTGKKDIQSVLTEVARLQRSIGTSVVGKTLVDQLFENMRITEDTTRLKKEAEVKAKLKEEKKVDPIQKATAQLSSAIGKTLNEMLKTTLKAQTITSGQAQPKGEKDGR